MFWKFIPMELKHYINKKSILICLSPYPTENVKRRFLGNDMKVQISTDIIGIFFLNPPQELLYAFLPQWVRMTILWGGYYNYRHFTQGTKKVCNLLKPQLLGSCSWTPCYATACWPLKWESLDIINTNSYKERDVQRSYDLLNATQQVI